MKTTIPAILLVVEVILSTTGAEEAVTYVKLGDKVTLKPSVNPNARYMFWLLENLQDPLASCHALGGWSYTSDERWTGRLSVSGMALTISDVAEDDYGTFTFSKLVGKDRIPVATFRLGKITVSMSLASPVLPGDSVSLACDAEAPQGHSKPTVYWLSPRGDKIVRTRSPGGKLTMTATSQDHGQWTCVVMNPNKEDKATINVTVLNLSTAPCPQYTSEFSPLTIPCSFPADVSWEQLKAKGIQEVYWQFFPKPFSSVVPEAPQRLFSLSLENPMAWKREQDRGLRPVTGLHKGNLTLIQHRGNVKDRGDYVCTLKFQNGVTLTSTIHVEVLQVISSTGTKVIKGQPVNLTCSFGRARPCDLQVKWSPPAQSSIQSLTSDHHPAHLAIPKASDGDGGRWRCELRRNNSQLASAVITLTIAPTLDVWMWVAICGAAVIVVLAVLVFILYRHRRRKTRSVRHRLCQCKNPKPKGFYRT